MAKRRRQLLGQQREGRPDAGRGTAYGPAKALMAAGAAVRYAAAIGLSSCRTSLASAAPVDS